MGTGSSTLSECCCPTVSATYVPVSYQLAQRAKTPVQEAYSLFGSRETAASTLHNLRRCALDELGVRELRAGSVRGGPGFLELPRETCPLLTQVREVREREVDLYPAHDERDRLGWGIRNGLLDHQCAGLKPG